MIFVTVRWAICRPLAWCCIWIRYSLLHSYGIIQNDYSSAVLYYKN